uniref:THAP-type domain-containing protein n=1 Tax=Sipha flava TaxID=143950 RepID=A0A2S2Q539_9HEMI
MNDISNTKDNMDVHNYCSIPGCNNKYNDTIGSETLFVLGDESRANKLSLIYGVKLTTNSTLCKRHFDAADTNENEIPLENNCALKAPNTYRNASKRSIIDNENDDLTIKKTKNNFSDESKTTTSYKNVDEKYISTSPVLSNHIPNDAFVNTQDDSSEERSSLDELFPKILANKSLSVTLNSLGTVQHYSGQDGVQIEYHPEDIIEEDKPKKPVIKDSLSITSSSDESIPLSLQSKFKEIISKSRHNKPISITFEKKVNPNENLSSNVLPSYPEDHSDYVTSLLDSEDNYLQVRSEQVSAIDSTKTINSTIDDNNELVCIKLEPVDDLFQTISTDDVKSDFCEPNVNKNSPLTSTIDFAPKTKESTEQKSLPVSNLNIKSEPIDTIDDESQTLNESYLVDNFQSNAESTIPTTSNVKYMTDILQNNTNESMPRKSTKISTTNYTNQVNSSVNLNSTPISVHPSTSANNIITISEESKLKQLLLNSSSNSSISITTVHSDHQPNVSNTYANCSLVNTSQSNYLLNGQQSTANSRATDQVYSNSLVLPYNNKQLSIVKRPLLNKKRRSQNNQSVDNTTPVIFSCVSLNSNQNKNNEYKQASLSMNEIAKSISLPGNFWRHHINIKSKAHRFIELDQNMKPIKKIYFYKSLVPDININGKSFEYYEEIRTPNQLETLLEKIDEIEICIGYNGLHHEKCIAYFEDTSEETELCHNCKMLMTDSSNFSEDDLIKNKSILTKRLQNQLFELEDSIAQIKNKKKIQMQKREDLENILKVINPFKVLNALKPPAYIN